ncbi:SdpI family protein [Patescibacteria group bacterium]|nr:SdpI family protein [Patescibacteria group bacterium]
MKKYLYLQLFIVALMCAVGFYFYDLLPDPMPSHWNFAGEVDGYMTKKSMIVIIPAITLGMTILFKILSKIDPKRKNYELFKSAWGLLQTTLIAYMAYIYFVSIYAALSPGVNVGAYVLGGIGALFILLGNFLGKIRQNYFVGIKTPWTLNSEDNWNKTHRVAGWTFVVGGLLIILQAAFLPHLMAWMFFSTIAVIALLPILYSFLIYKWEK